MAEIPTTGPLSFGFRRSATHTHQGVDLVAPEGTPVYAIEPGQVEYASATLAKGFSGYGGHVVYRAADGKRWLLGHLSAVSVIPGQELDAGAELGRVGRTCYSDSNPAALCEGPHLHLELSAVPYPQASEAPRLDPVPRLRELGGLASIFGLFSVPGNPPPQDVPRPTPAPTSQRASSGALWGLGALAGAGIAGLLWWRRGR